MFRDYYQILHLLPSANAEEIKRAYRNLARKLHPDSSSHPEAHERFSLLNEAYQTLSDPLKKQIYDYKYYRYQAGEVTAFERRMPRPASQRPGDPTPQDAEELARQYRAAKARQQQKRQREFLRYRPAVFVAFGLCLLFALSLFADWLLAEQTEALQIIRSERVITPTGREQCEVFTPAFSVRLPCEQTEMMGQGDFLALVMSPLYQVPVRFRLWQTTWPYANRQAAQPEWKPADIDRIARPGVYNLFAFFPILLFLSSVIGLFLWEKPELAFKFGLLSVGSLPFTIFFLWLS